MGLTEAGCEWTDEIQHIGKVGWLRENSLEGYGVIIVVRDGPLLDDRLVKGQGKSAPQTSLQPQSLNTGTHTVVEMK